MAKILSKDGADGPSYECVSPIEHDGRPIAVGDVVQMPVEIAEPLVKAGALVVAAQGE
jgi:hypothetical protein